jgi:hypothetical protein
MKDNIIREYWHKKRGQFEDVKTARYQSDGVKRSIEK